MTFNAADELIDFVADGHGAVSTDGKSFTDVRWSTPGLSAGAIAIVAAGTLLNRNRHATGTHAMWREPLTRTRGGHAPQCAPASHSIVRGRSRRRGSFDNRRGTAPTPREPSDPTVSTVRYRLRPILQFVVPPNSFVSRWLKKLRAATRNLLICAAGQFCMIMSYTVCPSTTHTPS
jgi:hypothetical protein